MKYSCCLWLTLERTFKICSQPALVFRQQSGNKIGGGFGARACQILPCRLCLHATWHKGAFSADANVAAVEIKHGAVLKQLSNSKIALKENPGFRIHLGERPIQAGEGVIA